jgi:hypothetical protein
MCIASEPGTNTRHNTLLFPGTPQEIGDERFAALRASLRRKEEFASTLSGPAKTRALTLVKQMDARSRALRNFGTVRRTVRNPTLRKQREGWERHTVLTSQGFTQKHPNWLHLKTSPGMQRITELPGEILDFLAFCV